MENDALIIHRTETPGHVISDSLAAEIASVAEKLAGA
jgi:hypothetical protein